MPRIVCNDPRAARFTLRNHPEFGTVTFFIWPGDDDAFIVSDGGEQITDIASARDIYRRLRDECRRAA
jgi:hypothetical protein